ncbi:hypothetical protein BPAE_0068g00380 [Botrytis paeoniae]|uniref:Uncharacterized protein n=1 Tax=Botrytis paeoniae TaxID=278948 RepID=A0A4Z1FMC4_9HELO|nr:hypothetical protein BPAE_0068g00380 [Botrytis paeoniae]
MYKQVTEESTRGLFYLYFHRRRVQSAVKAHTLAHSRTLLDDGPHISNMPFKHPSKSLRIFAYSTRWLVSKNIHTADAAPIPHLSARLPRSLPADSSEDTTNDMFAHAVMCFNGVLGHSRRRRTQTLTADFDHR